MKEKNSVREGYKLTELGEIPVEWDIQRLGEVAEIIMGQSPESKYYNEEGKGVPFFQGKTEFGEIYPIIKKWCTNPTKISKYNDVLVSVRAPVGDVNINNIKEACIGRGLAAIRQTRKSHYGYLFYVLKVNKSNLEKISQGSTFTAISSSDLQNLLIPLPPLPEQKKIAEILSTVDEQIEQTEQLIEKTKELKNGLMQRLLTKGIGHTRFKKTELGEIPEEWEVKRLIDIANESKNAISDGPFGSNLKISDYINDPQVPVLQGKNITTNKFVWEDIRYISYEKANELERSIVKEGDILLTKIGTVGCVAIIDNLRGFKKAVIPANLLKITPNNNKINKYFLYYILLFSSNRIKELASQTAQPALSLKVIKPFKIQVPPLDEQEKIVNILLNIDNKIDHYESRKHLLQQLKKGLMQKLLTGKIRVKV